MTEPKVVKNSGALELRPDGSLAFVNWCVEGGGPNPGLNVVDAVIALLQEKREECGKAFDGALEIPLR